MAINRGPKILGAAILAGAAIFGANHYLKNHGEVENKSSTVKVQGDLQQFDDSAALAPVADGKGFTAPGTAAAPVKGLKVKVQVIPWNALAGFALANGGPETTVGSLMAQRGVNLSIERKDMYDDMKASLVACANELKQGARVCSTGVNLVAIMGDAGATFLPGLNEALSKIGPEYQAELVPGFGRSFGEDKFMASPEVKADPKKLAGLVAAAVKGDGDMNVGLYFARQNGTCNNPDPKTYNPDCLNWVETPDFGDADKKYIAGYCEDRPVVRNDDKGVTKRTGETFHACVNAVATWFPGDKEVFDNKGGLVSVWSTKENSSQMATVFVGIRKWNLANRTIIENITDAALEGGKQIRQFGGPALIRAGAAQAAIYKEGTAQYWAKYYKGVTETDVQGNSVELGGSQAFDLPMAARYFGLVDGAANAYADAYTLFGKIMQEQYPKDYGAFPPVSTVLNTSYLKAVLDRAGQDVRIAAAAPVAEFSAGAATGATLARRAWSINFKTGSSALTADGIATVAQLREELNMSGATVIEVHGHTDNTGNPTNNLSLSAARAQAVKAYLQQVSPVDFPDNRVKTQAHGQQDPVAPNTNEAGRSKNRRVEIVIKSNS